MLIMKKEGRKKQAIIIMRGNGESKSEEHEYS